MTHQAGGLRISRARPGPPRRGRAAACGSSAGPASHRALRTARGPRRAAPGRRSAPTLRARVPPPLDRHRTEHLGTGGQLQGGQRLLEIGRLPDDGGDPGGRRQMGGLAFLDLAAGETDRVPAHQGLQARVRGVPHAQRPGRRRSQGARGGSVGPPAYGLLGGPQVRAGRAGARCPAAPPRRSRRSRPARPRAWPPRSPDAVDRRQHAVPEDDVRTMTPGRARPSSSAVRASPSTGARRPCPPHSAASPSRVPGGAPGALGRALGPRSRSGPWQTVHRAGVRHRSQASLVA